MEAFQIELTLGGLALVLAALGVVYVKWEGRRFDRRWGKR